MFSALHSAGQYILSFAAPAVEPPAPASAGRKRTRKMAADNSGAEPGGAQAARAAKENTPAKRSSESLMTQSTRKRAKAMSAANGSRPGGTQAPAGDADEAVPRVLEARFGEEVRPRHGAREPPWASAAASLTLGALTRRWTLTRRISAPARPRYATPWMMRARRSSRLRKMGTPVAAAQS